MKKLAAGKDIVLAEKIDSTMVITFNRPDARNAMSAALYTRCIALLAKAYADPSVRCVVLTGAGTCFSGGRDLKERNVNRQSAADYLEHTLFSEEGPAHFYSYLTQYRKPIITAINGPAVAGGCIVAALGDISIASDRAFFALPEINRGIPPPGGVMVFPKLMSRCKGVYLLLTGEQFSAQEAERIGMITRVVPHRKLMTEALAVARNIGGKSPVAVRLLKTAILASQWGDDLRMNIGREAVRAIGDVTRDRIEGIQAFAEHKNPSKSKRRRRTRA
ncbi:MAG: enoyl-CoA hydratase/isomerase family protein [Betaproteobacteria bacterium]|nr:enoyl-CoA hydratase/isomerase family protein [Betaproteobacteria bacterium]